MVTLHILQLLQDQGFGTIDTDLFFGKLGLDEVGLYITPLGTPRSRGTRKVQGFEIYARGSDDIQGAEQLERVLELFEDAEGTICDLPVVPEVSDRIYKNVDLEGTSEIEEVGLDSNNRVIYVISGQIRYDKLRQG